MNLGDSRYFGFLVIVFILFYLLRTGAQRRMLLLAASYFFYFELSHYYVAVLLGVTAVAYYGALLLRRRAGKSSAFLFFVLVCVVLLAPLLAFKYIPPLLGLLHVDTRTGLGIDISSLVIPAGISFFTFAALGYLIDVYLEIVDPEPRLERVALFLAFFPVVSAGPIERAQGLMPQLDLERPFSCDRALSALRTILLGLVMKVIVADFLSGIADDVFANPAAYSALDRFLGTVDYAFYLYADFAGYSLIAIGSARLLGLDVKPNFAQPFLSTTIPEFWRRWHMSLSFWVRDYIFSPLRMSWRRTPQAGMAAALACSFTILGVWHGAKWGYLIFGMLHGLYAVVSFLTLKKRNEFWARLGVPERALAIPRGLITFFLVVLAFVFYRANTLSDALLICRSIFSFEILKEAGFVIRSLALHPFSFQFYPVASALPAIKKRIGFFLLLLFGDIIARRKISFASLPAPIRIAIVNAAILTILSYWILGQGNQPFVYYKF